MLAHLSSPTKNTIELFLGDGPSTECQEVYHVKKKSVEFNLNIPECSTEHLQQGHLDQPSASMHALLQEHVEPYPNRPVHLKSCISPSSTNKHALLQEHIEPYPNRSVHPKSCIPQSVISVLSLPDNSLRFHYY